MSKHCEFDLRLTACFRLELPLQPLHHLLNRSPSSARQDVGIDVQCCSRVAVAELFADQFDRLSLGEEIGGDEMPQIMETRPGREASLL